MPKLPVCPYCGRVLEYKESAAAMRVKEYRCRKCKKLSRVSSLLRRVILGAVLAAALIAVNTLMLFSENNKTLLPNLIVTLIGIAMYFIFSPLCTRLAEIEGQRDTEPQPKLKKNRHRQKKTRYKDVTFKQNPLEGTSFDE